MNRVANRIMAVALDARAALSAALGPATSAHARAGRSRGRHRAPRR
ncbi:MAG TPA: hypothetical protein VGN37_04830 [Actinocatenispora sp.]